MKKEHPIYSMAFAKVYVCYVEKAEKKQRKKGEVDELIRWLTGYSQKQLERRVSGEISFRDFFDQAPEMNPDRSLIKGVVCGIRVEEVKEPLMREIRYLDKLIDELAKGKDIDKIKR